MNVSKRRDVGFDMQRETIARYMEMDSRLWAYANEFLDSKLAELIPDEVQRQEYLSDFRRRCNKMPVRDRFAAFEKKVRSAAKAFLARAEGSA